MTSNNGNWEEWQKVKIKIDWCHLPSGKEHLSFIGKIVNKILKWLHDHWDNSIVYFDTKEKK